MASGSYLPSMAPGGNGSTPPRHGEKSRSLPRRSRQNAFTLIELMVVTAIIAIVMALLLPAVVQAREAARRTQCRNNLKQIGLSLHNYHDAHSVLPPGMISSNLFSWKSFLMPLVEQSQLYNSFNFNAPVFNGNDTYPATDNAFTATIPIEMYHCPSDPGPTNVTNGDPFAIPNSTEIIEQATSSYVGNYGSDGFATMTAANGIMFTNSRVSLPKIRDGVSNTVAAGEHLIVDPATSDRISAFWFGSPTGEIDRLTGSGSFDINARVVGDFSSMHEGGAFFLMCDGAVIFLNESIASDTSIPTGSNMATFQKLLHRYDRLPIGEYQ